MDPNQAEKIMKELEGAMGGMDEDNPDPKQMGQLMRKMCEMTGESMDETMEEVVRKLRRVRTQMNWRTEWVILWETKNRVELQVASRVILGNLLNPA